MRATAARNGQHVVLLHRSISLAALSYRALALAPLPSFVKETRISAIAAFRCMFAFLRPTSVPSFAKGTSIYDVCSALGGTQMQMTVLVSCVSVTVTGGRYGFVYKVGSDIG